MRQSAQREDERPTLYVVGGTTETVRAIERLQQEGFRLVVSVATDMGAEMDMPGCEVQVGRKDSLEFARRAGAAGAAAIVDCSHPFAEDVSRQAAGAAGDLDIPVFRFSRAGYSSTDSHLVRAGSWEAAVHYLKQVGGRALMTIGVNNLDLFAEAGIDMAVRILSQPESMEKCRQLGIDEKKIIPAQPPFDVDFNRECIRNTGADIIVSKDSGEVGGLDAKVDAAAAEGIELLMVERPGPRQAFDDLDTLVGQLLRELDLD